MPWQNSTPVRLSSTATNTTTPGAANSPDNGPAPVTGVKRRKDSSPGGRYSPGLVPFQWTTFDVTATLPPNWQREIGAVAAGADFREFPRTPVLSREGPDVPFIRRGRVHADQVRDRLPWLYAAYRGNFRTLASQASREDAVAAGDERYGVVLNVQQGTTMRFECHVDSNPLTGLLFLTDHAAGGELVISHDPHASDIAAVEVDCSVIRPHAGHLILFDARRHPHYARPLSDASGTRIVAVMNFYTESCPESTRPLELNQHLYGTTTG